MPRKVITRALLALAIALAAIVATTGTALAADPGVDGNRQIEFCSDEAEVARHGGGFRCFEYTMPDGSCVRLKAKHRNGWRAREFEQQNPGAVRGCSSATGETADPFVSDRRVYCLGGVAVDLLKSQPDEDPAYAGATPAAFVEGEGATCDLAGLTYVPDVWRDGFSDTAYDALLAELAGDLYPLATR